MLLGLGLVLAQGMAAPPCRGSEPAPVFGQSEGRYEGRIEGSYVGVRHPYPGRVDYLFQVTPADRVLQVEFAAPLAAAKVEATGYGGGGTFPLLARRRIQGTLVSIAWPGPSSSLSMVVISVHHHLRGTPVVRRWRTGAAAEPGSALSAGLPG
jgi:hypothetical protein